MCHGLSQGNPIYVVELDPKTFKEIGTQIAAFSGKESLHGWERRGEGTVFESDLRPWVEGAWMIKENGKYYLEYSPFYNQF